MADDDIEKLLREIDAMNRGGNPAAAKPAQVQRADDAAPERSGRVAWAGAGAIGGLAVGGIAGTVLAFLPYVSTASTAIGAAVGGAVVGFVSRPPGWFSRRR